MPVNVTVLGNGQANGTVRYFLPGSTNAAAFHVIVDKMEGKKVVKEERQVQHPGSEYAHIDRYLLRERHLATASNLQVAVVGASRLNSTQESYSTPPARLLGQDLTCDF